MAEKFDGFQILVAAIAVRYPLTVLASIVQIKHGSYGIHAQTVYVELLNPVEGVGNQEIGNLMLFIVKDLGTPVWMLAFTRICILEERLSVKICQTVGIPREMGRNPVQNNADALFVHIVHKIFEFLWSAIAGGGSIVAGYLIAPGTIIGMFRNSHQLDMGVTHLLYIGSQLGGSFLIGIITVFFRPVFLFPGT